MVKFHDFLVEHAKFPFPLPDLTGHVDTTDISELEVGLLAREWKAKLVVRDDTLAQPNILEAITKLLRSFVIASRIFSGTPLCLTILKRPS